MWKDVCLSLMLFVGLRHINSPSFPMHRLHFDGRYKYILIKLILRKTLQPHGNGHAVQYGDFYT